MYISVLIVCTVLIVQKNLMEQAPKLTLVYTILPSWAVPAVRNQMGKERYVSYVHWLYREPLHVLPTLFSPSPSSFLSPISLPFTTLCYSSLSVPLLPPPPALPSSCLSFPSLSQEAIDAAMSTLNSVLESERPERCVDRGHR